MPISDQLERLHRTFHELESNIQKYLFCVSLQDRNETLFYKFLSQNIKEVAPVIYTPTGNF